MSNNLQWKPFYSLNGKHKEFPTYRDLKKALPEALKEESEIHVFRTRRGEWGEWFEIWEMKNGKPTIVKKGWQ